MEFISKEAKSKAYGNIQESSDTYVSPQCACGICDCACACGFCIKRPGDEEGDLADSLVEL